MNAGRICMTAALMPAAFVCGAAAQSRAPVRSSGATSLSRRVDSIFARIVRPDGPGCAVGVYRGGNVILSRGYGLASVEDKRPITPRTAFNVGSVAKPFTALAALMLEQQGKLSLDDDVRRWIPELPNYGAPIRIRDLLHHTSGLRDYGATNILTGRDVSTMAEFLGLMVAQQRLNFATGTQHEYSHSDFVLLAIIVERIAQAPFGAHLERTVLGPLGMNGSFVQDERTTGRKDRAFGHVISDGRARVQFPGATVVGGTNLYVSVDDLARWNQNFDVPNVGGRPIITRMLSRPTLPAGDTIPYAYGLRLGTHRGLKTIFRGGHDNAMTSEVIRFPDQGLTVATLCNADNLEARLLAESVADVYLGKELSPRGTQAQKPIPPTAVAVAPNELERYAGVYGSPDRPYSFQPIELRDGKLGEVLFHETHDDTLYAMTPAGGGRFFEIGTTGNVGVFTFKSASPSGVPTSLEISWNGGRADENTRIPDSVLWRPVDTQLAEFVGLWFSQELSVAWQLEQRGGRLVLRRPGKSDLTLRPAVRDVFIRGFGPGVEPLLAELRFHRDSAGRLIHMTLSTPPGEDSARGIKFVRVAGQ